jgi:hypothetical protein
VWSNHFTFSI